jgi:hypothetical protein
MKTLTNILKTAKALQAVLLLTVVIAAFAIGDKLDLQEKAVALGKKVMRAVRKRG